MNYVMYHAPGAASIARPVGYSSPARYHCTTDVSLHIWLKLNVMLIGLCYHFVQDCAQLGTKAMKVKYFLKSRRYINIYHKSLIFGARLCNIYVGYICSNSEIEQRLLMFLNGLFSYLSGT